MCSKCPPDCDQNGGHRENGQWHQVLVTKVCDPVSDRAQPVAELPSQIDIANDAGKRPDEKALEGHLRCAGHRANGRVGVEHDNEASPFGERVFKGLDGHAEFRKAFFHPVQSGVAIPAANEKPQWVRNLTAKYRYDEKRHPENVLCNDEQVLGRWLHQHKPKRMFVDENEQRSAGYPVDDLNGQHAYDDQGELPFRRPRPGRWFRRILDGSVVAVRRFGVCHLTQGSRGTYRYAELPFFGDESALGRWVRRFGLLIQGGRFAVVRGSSLPLMMFCESARG